MEMDGKTLEGGPMGERELGERIALIESMMREGRRSTEYWGWCFLLWGVAYLAAIGWTNYLPAGEALGWPVTMTLAVALTIGIARRRSRNRPRTDRMRSVLAIWTAMGWGIFIFAFPASYSGHFEAHAFMAAIEVMLGTAHVASGIMVRWTTQIVIGGLWWAAAMASCFVRTRDEVWIILVAATLVCNIGFGIYLMIRESRERAQGAVVQHA